MAEIKPFLYESMDPSEIRNEWENWIRSFELYCDSNDITDCVKKRTKLLLLGGSQIQNLAYDLPDAMEKYVAEKKNDVYATLLGKLKDHLSPVRNSAFERHTFRNMRLQENERVSEFLLKLRHQAKRCDFGNDKKTAVEINLKDRLIDSCSSVALKEKLLEKEYSLDEIVSMIQVHEQIQSQAKIMMKQKTRMK
jgi:hypothetical protein